MSFEPPQTADLAVILPEIANFLQTLENRDAEAESLKENGRRLVIAAEKYKFQKKLSNSLKMEKGQAVKLLTQKILIW